MIEVGRVCYKIAGREAGKPCVILESAGANMVLIDGLVRRKKCNIKHLEFTSIVLPIKKGASTVEVQDALLKAKIVSSIPKKGEPRAAKSEPKDHKVEKAEPKDHKVEKKEEHKAKKAESKKPKKAAKKK
jgi:large subunit ribosomal protein L14e